MLSNGIIFLSPRIRATQIILFAYPRIHVSLWVFRKKNVKMFLCNISMTYFTIITSSHIYFFSFQPCIQLCRIVRTSNTSPIMTKETEFHKQKLYYVSIYIEARLMQRTLVITTLFVTKDFSVKSNLLL